MGDSYRKRMAQLDKVAVRSSRTKEKRLRLLVQAWPVAEGRLAEEAAHVALESHRLADNREFFQAKYSELGAKLEAAIAAWLIL